MRVEIKMALFDNLKVMKDSLSKTANNIANTISTVAKEQENISIIEKEISILKIEIEAAYTQIGRQFVDYVLETGEMPGVDVSDILTMLDPKMTRKLELEQELIEIQKRLKDQTLIQEKNRLEEQFRNEKEKLDKALAMEILSKDEYEQKVSKFKKRIEKFEDIKKIEQQYELKIISRNEMEEKISDLLCS